MGAKLRRRVSILFWLLTVFIAASQAAGSDGEEKKGIFVSLRPAVLTNGYVLILAAESGFEPADVTVVAVNRQYLQESRWTYPKFNGRVEIGSIEGWDWQIGEAALISLDGGPQHIYDVVRSNEHGATVRKRVKSSWDQPWYVILFGFVGLFVALVLAIILYDLGGMALEEYVLNPIGDRVDRFKAKRDRRRLERNPPAGSDESI